MSPQREKGCFIQFKGYHLPIDHKTPYVLYIVPIVCSVHVIDCMDTSPDGEVS